jgi:hypothetical protein
MSRILNLLIAARRRRFLPPAPPAPDETVFIGDGLGNTIGDGLGNEIAAVKAE